MIRYQWRAREEKERQETKNDFEGDTNKKRTPHTYIHSKNDQTKKQNL